ncbi:hypothetical protein GALMADRAFT_51883 [Galerina marginata CBS 339.88]|uniref:G-patch domain-containing protein n=1 Tax=Galerina marginata (strain CBS 339.88) TaxID=685588 RepID=A0A067U0A8_GALM3|nr:hypothetical protein GALMADRAFT_51883 [Galerina marginata CBS 339.88]
MDVDESHLHKYDEYIRRPAREVITVETKIKPSNKGFALLAKLGWVAGQPVGLSGEGRVDPIPFHIKSDLTGLGKASQDVRMIEETVSQRRGLDSERQQRESEEQRRLREDTVARKTALESEISSTLRAFYCTLCDKQFKNVAQYDEHTNSYAHHHKARFKDMQANVRIKPQDEVEKRKEKERKREEKELRKIAAASGIKIPKPVAIPNPSIALAPPSSSDNDNASVSTMEVDPKSTEPKRSNWASGQGSNSPAPSHGGSGFRKSGWATVGGPSSNSNLASSSSRFGPPPSASSPFPVEPATNPNLNHVPTFRNAGWTSLDTGSSLPPPAASTPNHHGYEPAPPPVPNASTHGSWSRGFASTTATPSPPRQEYDPAPPPPSDASGREGWSTGFSSTSSSSAGLGSSSSSRQWQSSFAPAAPPPPQPPSDPVQSLLVQPPASLPAPAPERKPARANWQQFQKGVGRRK